MSVFISAIAPEAAVLITDGASWDEHGNLDEVKSKVYRSQKAPFAVTGNGRGDGIEWVGQNLCRIADEIGATAAIERLQELVSMLCSEAGGEYDGSGDSKDILNMVVAAYVPGIGGVHRFFSSIAKGISDDHGNRTISEPWQVSDPCSQIFGRFPSIIQMQTAGIPPCEQNEPPSRWIRNNGAAIMEILRRNKTPVQGVDQYYIGGMAEFTLIDARGARTERLCTWPDVIGKPIDPTRRAA